MPHDVCPWWLGYFLAGRWRRLVQDPAAILRPYVTEGTVVFEPGPGMGFFTLELARLAGRDGKVVAVDVQPRMVSELRRRAGEAGLADRIDVRLGPGDGMGIDDLRGRVDFVLAFAVVHELPDPERFFAEAYAALKPGGRLLLAEPAFHISRREFETLLGAARRSGFPPEGPGPSTRWTRTAVLRKELDAA